MKRILYICDYPYTLFETLIKVVCDQSNECDLLFCNSLSETEPLYPYIKNSNLFHETFFYDDEPFKNEISKILSYSNEQTLIGLIKGFILILKSNQTVKKISLPLDITKYDVVYYSDRLSTLMFYLNVNNISYIAMQHALNIWQVKLPKDVFKIQFFGILEKLHISCGINCYTKACKAIEVTENLGIEHLPRGKKIIEWNINKVILTMPSIQKEFLFDLYCSAYHVKFDYSLTYNVLLTNPLFNSHFVSSLENQVRFYHDIIKKYLCEDKPLIIKPHPRDDLDYCLHFKNCIIINSGISCEVLNLSPCLCINKVLTLCSTSAESFRSKAHEIIIMEKTQDPELMTSLDGYR